MPINEQHSVKILAEFHEERLHRAEDRLSELEGDQRVQMERSALQIENLSQKVQDFGDRLIEKVDTLAGDIGDLKKRFEYQGDSIGKLKEKESRRAKRNALMFKVAWIIPAGLLVELGHQLAQILLKR